MPVTTHGIDWSNLESGFKPGSAAEALYVLRGLPGVGKTSFASGCPNSLLLDCDPQAGGRYAVGARAERATVNNWASFLKVFDNLMKDAKTNGAERRFKTVIIDPAGIFLQHCREETKRRLGVAEIEGFDHGKVANLFREKLLDLAYAGYYWIVIDQLVKRTALQKGGSEAVFVEALLPQSAVKYMELDCHHILTMSLKPVMVDEIGANGKKTQKMQMSGRVLETKPGTSKTSIANPKSRVWLPEAIDIPFGTSAKSWDAFSAAYDTAVHEMAAYQDAN